MKSYELFGAPLSLYTGKARSYLTYKGIDFVETLSTVKVYKNVIVPNTGVRFIPVLKTPNGEYLQDTVAIIESLETSYPARSIMPTTPKQRIVSEVFQIWGDEWLLIPAMHYRWNHDNFPFIYEQFGNVVSPILPRFIKRMLGKKVAAKFRGFVPLLGISDTSAPAIEDWYENHVLPLLNSHFSQHDYLLGSRPCAGDFGLMGPLYAHLLRDPAPGKIMRQLAPNVVTWIERMNNTPKEQGTWCENDKVPDTLLPLLSRIFSECWPVLVNTIDLTQKWIAEHPTQNEVPRTVGKHEFTIGDITERRAAMPFHQWKVQRVSDCFDDFSKEQQRNVQDWLSARFDVQIEPLKHITRLTRKANKLVVEGSS